MFGGRHEGNGTQNALLSLGALSYLEVLAPDPDWVRRPPNGKLPDRTDFPRYGTDLPSRVKAWSAATAASRQLADEFAAFVERPDPRRVEAL